MSPRKVGLPAGQLPQETRVPPAEAGARGARRQPGPISKGTGSESELWSCCWSQMSGLPALQGATLKWRQLLPLAQALRARHTLPSGERQGDLVPKRET